jgi:hypothetical protein
MDAVALEAEILQHHVTDEDVGRCVNEYKEHLDHDKLQIVYCASCGNTMIDNSETKLPIEELTSLKLPSDEYDNWLDTDPQLQKLYSVFHDDNAHCAYYLHAELVLFDGPDGDKPYIFACKHCADAIRKKKIWKYSIANGCDYGGLWRSTLPELSLFN